jgi:hypothetical protein
MFVRLNPLSSYVLLLVSIVLTGSVSVVGRERPFELFAISNLVRVFEDGYNLPQARKVIDIFGIRNEHICAQCVIKANQHLRRVTATLNDAVGLSERGPIVRLEEPEVVVPRPFKRVGLVFATGRRSR